VRSALFVLALGCSGDRGDASTALGQVRVTLDEGWDSRPWTDLSAPRQSRISLSTTLALPDDLPRAGAVLELEGAWRQVDVTVNGTALDPVDGGLAVAEVAVGPFLHAGENSLTVTISAPSNPTRLAMGGGLGSVGLDPNRALLFAPPTLVLRPAVHLTDVLLRTEGDDVQAWAKVWGAVDGTVVFTARMADGSTVSLGQAALEGGWAGTDSIAWEGPRWTPRKPGRDALFELQATLLSSSGDPLDRLDQRTAVREVEGSSRGLRLDGVTLPLLGLRAVPSPQRPRLTDHLPDLHASGLNAIELHGDVALDAWLDDTDELGIPVVLVPRCAGRVNGDSEAGLSEQMEALLRRLQRHPSVVLLASDPAGVVLPPLVRTIGASRWPRPPMTGIELEARALEIPGDGRPPRCFPEDCAGWIVEATPAWKRLDRAAREQLGEADKWAPMAPAWALARDRKAVGGIFPHLEAGGRDPANHPFWLSAARSAAEAFGVTALDTQRRGPSHLRVSGAAAGALVVARSASGAAVGAVADGKGEAELSLWGSGPVAVVSGNMRGEGVLTPSTWADLTEQRTAVEVRLGVAQ